MTTAALLLGAVTIERLLELWWARRNTTALLARGAREVAPGHYPAIVFLHAIWLASLWIFGWAVPLNLYWLTVFLALQSLRAWILISLGGRWTTRIIVVPGAPLVTRGPYRNSSDATRSARRVSALPPCLRRTAAERQSHDLPATT